MKPFAEVSLAPVNPELADWWYQSRLDAETIRYNPLAPSSVESLRERLSKAHSDLARYSEAETFLWVVQIKSEILGYIAVQNINRMMRTAEIGYGVTAQARGRGIATSAVSLVARNCFEQTPLRKLIAFVHEDNLASRKVLERVGFKQEGILREHYLVNGEPANEIIYGLLRRDLVLG